VTADRPRPVLVWLETRGFRAFGHETRRLALDAPLVVVHADNSQGKTSLAEAVEFLLTGRSTRRELLGGAKAEYDGSLRNAHLPDGDHDVYVAAGVRGPDGVLHEVRRDLTEDFAAGSQCRSRLLIDGVAQPDLAALGLRPADPPVVAPVLLQHTLRYVLSTEPKQRVGYFKALLALTDLDELRQRLGAVRARLESAAPGPGLGVVAGLARTPYSGTGRTLQNLCAADGGADRDVPEAVRTALLAAGQQATGVASDSVDDLSDALTRALARQRDGIFPVSAFTAVSDVPAGLPPLDLSPYQEALSAADRSTAELAPVIAAVLAAPAFRDLSAPVDCPVCAASRTLTPDRLKALRDQQRRTHLVDESAAAALNQVRRARAAVARLGEVLADGIPAAADWDSPQAETAGQLLERLDLDSGPLHAALAATASLAAAVGAVRRQLASVADALVVIEENITRREDITDGLASTQAQLAATMAALRTERQSADDTAALLASAVEPALRARTAAAGLTELLAVVRQGNSLAGEINTARARQGALRRLAAADRALAAGSGKVLDTRFTEMSTAIERWWLSVRPDELVSFGGVKRRAGGARFINLVGALRTDRAGDSIERDALGIFSDSQLNALGLATFLARTQLLASPLVVLDDPVPGSDPDHRLTFIQNTLGLLLDEDTQVVLMTHDSKLADWAQSQHGHRDPVSYELTLNDLRAGPEVTQTSDAFSRLMAEAEENLHSPTSRGRRAACGSYRSAAERLAKQVIATGRTANGQLCSVANVEATMLAQLVPLVRGYALTSAEKGSWTTFSKVLNPGNHDDDVPATADLKMIKGNLRRIAKDHQAHWPGGLLA
jgi:hypothetical protein